LNKVTLPWMKQHGFNVTDNFGQFANTQAGVLALSLFYEQTTGTVQLYAAIAQVMLNRLALAVTNPVLASQLGIAPVTNTAPSLSSIVEFASNVWSNGNLNPKTENGLITMMNDSVVGASNSLNAGACNQFISAANTAYVAANSLAAPIRFDSNIGVNTYWFYIAGAKNPVSTAYWNTTYQNIQSNKYDWTFETYVSKKPAPPRPRPGPRPR